MPELRTAAAARAALRAEADPARARVLLRFFKTGKGEYGEGDRFLGLTVPQTRAVLRGCALTLRQWELLLQSPWHEERLLAVLGLVKLCQRASPAQHAEVLACYLRNTHRINNWDLVDLSAPQVVGAAWCGRARGKLLALARSPLLWERRIAMLATFHGIRQGDAADALAVANALMTDEEDLIHKAVGWMLREVGKRCGVEVLRAHLEQTAARLPRTTLRYAIERLPPQERKAWLAHKPSSAPRRRAPLGPAS